MTAERDGKSGRGQPDLLASLPAERPAPGIDPVAIEELLAGVRDLREEVAELRSSASADRPAPVPAALPEALPAPLTPDALEAWGDRLVTRVAEAAQTADVPGDDAAVVQIGRIRETVAELTAEARRQNAELSVIGNKLEAARTADSQADEAAAVRIGRMEDAAAKAAAAAERIDGALDSTADRVAAEIEGAVTRIESNLKATRTHVTLQSRQANPILEDIRTQTAGPRFGLGMVLAGLIVLVAGMLLESRTHLLYRWLW